MEKDIIVVIGFIIVVIFACKIFNIIIMKQYKNNEKSQKLPFILGCNIENINKMELAGVGSDDNGDFEVANAIKKIEVPDDLRIKMNEEK